MRRLVLALAFIGAALVFVPAAGAWTWPLDGPVLRPYSLGPDAYAAGQHRGVDVQGGEGEPVRAPAPGNVSFAGVVPTHGRTVTIQTADGHAVSLTHLGSVVVAKGDTVAEGDPVGVAGSSGETEWPSPYVHLGVRTGSAADMYVDPMSLLPPRVVQPPAGPAPATMPTPAAVPATPAVGGLAQPADSGAPAAGAVSLPPSNDEGESPATADRGGQAPVVDQVAAATPDAALGGSVVDVRGAAAPKAGVSAARPTVEERVSASPATALPSAPAVAPGSTTKAATAAHIPPRPPRSLAPAAAPPDAAARPHPASGAAAGSAPAEAAAVQSGGRGPLVSASPHLRSADASS